MKNTKCLTTLAVLVLLIGAAVFFSTMIPKQPERITGHSVIASLHLEPEYYDVRAGETLIAQLDVADLESNQGRRDVEIITSIVVPDGETIELSKQTVAIETSLSKVITLQMPKTLPARDYIILVEIKDTKDKTTLATTSQRIFVSNRISLSPLEEKNIYYYSAFIFIGSIIALVITIILTRKK